ncbi:hypothetical protein GLOIN_2v1842379 [Rhizophagus irregularis DAOM 181602=DAOM 197198]|uniref:Uncharacterized protein n=1 Tax=Rhizophagus irregularis (strain DAOM 181602 / DAOM 197198 / MUCL 43194) TaxID=747089 RepID=U9UCY4_RHIID|nr:hypothetical protein GLOIN_2v1842379 [Rhizophagus irregularis DAOM 181602=DAOM 197198]
MCDTKRPARNSKVKAKLTELEEIFTTTSNDMEWQHIRTEALYTLSKEQGKAVRKKRDKTGRVNRLTDGEKDDYGLEERGETTSVTYKRESRTRPKSRGSRQQEWKKVRERRAKGRKNKKEEGQVISEKG